MKISIFILSMALFCTSFTESPISNPANGIRFQNITFQKALAEAKQQNKLVFLNAYAVWCAPCKRLKQTTFQSDKVATLVNKKCISIDVDVEKGEGISIAKKYQIQGHPLVLVINPEGKVVKRILGYMDEADFYDQIKGVMN